MSMYFGYVPVGWVWEKNTDVRAQNLLEYHEEMTGNPLCQVRTPA